MKKKKTLFLLWNKCIGILLDKIQVEFIINPILL